MKRIACLVLLSVSAAQAAVNWATYVEHILSFAGTGMALRYYVQLSNLADLPDASEQATLFVHDRLKLAGIAHWQKVRVKIGEVYGTDGKGIIALMKSSTNPERAYLDDMIDQSKAPVSDEMRRAAERSLLMHKAIISHEASHLSDNDAHKLTFACATIPVATYTVSFCLERALEALWPEDFKPHLSPTMQNIYKIGKGFGRHMINMGLFIYLSRMIEIKADANIPYDPAVLRGCRDFFYAMNNAIRERIRQRGGDKAVERYDTNRVVYELENFRYDMLHPSPLTRIHKLDEMLEEEEIPKG